MIEHRTSGIESAATSRRTHSLNRQVGVTLFLLGVLVVTFVVYVWSEKSIDAANTKRIDSLRLAEELRQSSDDLTRMARLYVATGDPLHQRSFQQILDIRDGRLPRPERYEGVYWDFVSATGVPPRPFGGSSAALLELMQAAGFSEAELAVLARAKVLSDALTQTEREAMRLRDDPGADAATGHARAIAMVHDAAYLAAKAAIMKPIDEVYQLMSARTDRLVQRAETRALLIRVVFITLALALMLLLYRSARTLHRVLQGAVDERHVALGALERNQTRLEEAQRLARLGNWELDLGTDRLSWSDEVYGIFEVQPADFVASPSALLGWVHPDDRTTVAAAQADSIAERRPFQLTYRLLMKDGRTKYVDQRGETRCDASGHPVRAVGTLQDITAIKASERALERLNRDLRLLSECTMTLVRADDEHRLLAEVCQICVATGGYLLAWVGYAEQDAARSVRLIAQGGDAQGYLDAISLSWAEEESGQGPTGQAIRSRQPAVNQNVSTNPAMSSWRAAALERGFRSSVALPLLSNGEVLGALNLYACEPDAFDPAELRLLMELADDLAYGIVALRTRSEHAVAKEKLAFLAHFDPLTHLPNRTLLRDRFEQSSLIAQAGHDNAVALLYIDLDRFTLINDSLGYAAGDQVIVEVVDRLHRCTPSTATISRLTGDEFVVLLHGGVEVPMLATLADAIRGFLSEPIKVDGNTLNVSCSIGIGLFPADGEDFDTLLKHSHTAVESAKEAGRNTCRFFSSEMNAGLMEQIRLTGGLTSALRKQEFLLHYQPQIDLRSGRIVGAEALVRWQHPEAGLVPPGKFIALAERSGHILQIGEWVLREACRQARTWLDQDPGAPVVAVNLSALQFKRGNVLELVKSALAGSGLPAHRLELELTESILLQDVAATMKTLHDLKALGVKLSIDDFGTGYSSLSYLKRLAVDKIKIDQTFVADMLADADGASIVKAIIQLGHHLNLTVIAEGVETDAQQTSLRDSGCDAIQGYLVSRPLEPRRFEAFMRDWVVDAAGRGSATLLASAADAH